MPYRLECNEKEFIERLTPKNGTPEGFIRDEYTPYRSVEGPNGTNPTVPLAKIKRTIKRPFVIPPKVSSEISKGIPTYYVIEGKYRIRAVTYKWLFGVGCSIFDGLCINQDDFSRIDCAACIKSTFESFIKGCEHQEAYVDQYGTRRCVACKDELGQDEPDDPPEMGDHSEDDDPAGEEDDPPEYSYPESFLDRKGMEAYNSWNLEGKTDQSAPTSDSDLDQRFKVRAFDPLDEKKYHYGSDTRSHELTMGEGRPRLGDLTYHLVHRKEGSKNGICL